MFKHIEIAVRGKPVTYFFGSGTDPISLLVVLVVEDRSLKTLRLRRFKLERDESWRDCS